jgi:hypothetical protein
MPSLKLEELLPREPEFSQSYKKFIIDANAEISKDPFSTTILMKLNNSWGSVSCATVTVLTRLMMSKPYTEITKSLLCKKPLELFLPVEFQGRKKCTCSMIL